MSARDGAPCTVVRFVRHDVLPNAYVFELGFIWIGLPEIFPRRQQRVMVHPGTLARKAAQAFVGARNTRGPYACLDRRQRPPSRSVRWGGERTECAAPTLSPHPSPAGLTRGSIIFVRTFCEDDGLRVKPGNDDVMPRVRRDPQPQSPHPPLAPL